jgi:hypothetical protein
MISFALAMFMGISLLAQWTVPTTIQLDGPNEADRQVQGLAAPTQPTDGANTLADRSATVSIANVIGINELTMSLTPAPSALLPGTRIIVKPAAANTGAVTLDVNGLGPIPVLKNVISPLDSADLQPGIPVQVIYDGAVFQTVTQLYPACPLGTKAVGRTVCIENNSREPASWYAANVLCTNAGMRLCGFTEWIQACLQSDNIFGTIVNYEWVDEAANSTNLAKLMGINEFTLAPDCRAGGHRIPTSPQRFRCCYDR